MLANYLTHRERPKLLKGNREKNRATASKTGQQYRIQEDDEGSRQTIKETGVKIIGQQYGGQGDYKKNRATNKQYQQKMYVALKSEYIFP